MKKLLLLSFLSVFVHQVNAQSCKHIEGINPDKEFENVLVKPLTNTEASSSFLIWIKKEVKPHRHNSHDEHVYVKEGSGTMLLGDEIIQVKTGDWVFIPKSTVHAVKSTGKVPLKVISIQAPEFKGADREWVNTTKWQ